MELTRHVISIMNILMLQLWGAEKEQNSLKCIHSVVCSQNLLLTSQVTQL